MTSDNFDSLSLPGKAWDMLKHAILPIVCFTYGSLAYYSRFIRANMQEVIRQDYIRTARAKGVPPRRVIWHHAFRNTLIPLVTLIGLTLPHLLERRRHPRADLQLARHGPAVLRIHRPARLRHDHGPDADVQRADAARPTAGRHPVRRRRPPRHLPITLQRSSHSPLASSAANHPMHELELTAANRRRQARPPSASGAKPGATSAAASWRCSPWPSSSSSASSRSSPR